MWDGMMKVINWEELGKVNKPYFTYLKKHISDIEKTGKYILGKNVEKLELGIAKYLNVKYCIAVGNGLDALTISLMALDLPKGSEVIVPSNTFYASVVAIVRAGLIPILCEPDEDTYNISANSISRLINKKTSAIMVVHLYGNPCEMDEICDLAKKHNLKLVEDCAQSFGAEYKHKKVGGFGNISAYSFYPTKNLGGIGDGGIICTNDLKLYNYCIKARTYGGSNYQYDSIGINSRMDEINAMFLRSKLKDIEKLNNKKIRNAKMYLNGIKNHSIILPKETPDSRHVFHIFCIRVENRAKFQKYLDKNSIKYLIHYPNPLYKQKGLKGFIHKEYPISQKLSNTILSLPCSAAHTKGEIRRIINVINKYEG